MGFRLPSTSATASNTNTFVQGTLNSSPGVSFTVAFYASRMDACFVDDERVESQPGDFYGGWITTRVVGPFKGSAGTYTW